MMLTALEIDKRIQSVEDTISDLEFQMHDHLFDSPEMDLIFDSIERYEKILECLKFRKAEHDMWCMKHISITCKETEKEWYVDCDKQLKLDI